MMAATAADLTLVSGLALAGLMMASLPAIVVGGLLAATVVFLLVHDALKVGVFHIIRID